MTTHPLVKKFLDMPNDSTQKTFAVALALCLVCSIVVSVAAVGLKDLQTENRLLDVKRNILEVAGLYQPGVDVDEAFEKIETRVVELASGKYVSDIDALAYDQRKAAKDPASSRALDGDEDLARIRRRADQAKVYQVVEDGQVRLLILPVHGYGLWSTMYGFLALEPDANTISSLKFYEHGETPGLGGEIDNPRWRSIWEGKVIYDDAVGSEPAITVVRGAADPAGANIEHQVDGLAGATLTSQGVDKLMKFWLGENGFGPYLGNFRNGTA